MDPRQAETLTARRLRLFALEAASVQEQLDGIVSRLVAGEMVEGSTVKDVAEKLRRSRERLMAAIGEDAA